MFDKLDAYNIIANLVPGAALTYALYFSGFPAPNPQALGAFLLVSFVAGVTVNRLGSLVLDPLLRSPNVRFLKPKDYSAFVGVERDDPKIEALVANAGLYRTFFTAGLVYLLLSALDWAVTKVKFSDKGTFVVFVLIGMLVFLFALRKEDGYIHTRINKDKSS